MSIRYEAYEEALSRIEGQFNGAYDGNYVQGFMSGAEWQASREPTEEEVRRAARAAFIADGFTGESWDADPHEGYVDMTRAVLRAVGGQV